MNSERRGQAADSRPDKLVDLQDLRRRKGSRNRGRRARGKSQRRRIRQVEIAFDRSACAAPIFEMQHVTVFAFMNDGRIVNLHELLATVEIRHGHEQVEPLALKEAETMPRSRGAPIATTASYINAAIFIPSSGGLNQRDRMKSDSLERTSGSLMSVTACGAGRPEQWPKKPLAPAARSCFRRQQFGDIGILEPEVAQASHRQIVTQRPCQHGAVDSAGGSPRDDIDDDPQLERSADVAQQIEIDGFGVVLGIGGIAMVEECRGRPLASIGDGMEGTGRPSQLQDLLGDPVHIDRKRDAAETNERNAEFFFAQYSVPRQNSLGNNTSEARCISRGLLGRARSNWTLAAALPRVGGQPRLANRRAAL